MEADLKTKSSYIAHLPAILQQGPFMERFLLAFEVILSGGIAPPPGGPPTPVGLEAALDNVHNLLMPDVAPEEFLPWLAQWVATSLRDDWDEATKRAFISKVGPLYRRRGTRSGLEDVLRICAGDVQVIELDNDTRPAHYFSIILTVANRDPIQLARLTRMVRAIVDREKPAHTIYGLTIKYPAMRLNNDPAANPDLGKGLVLGADPKTDPERTTILGTVSYSDKP